MKRDRLAIAEEKRNISSEVAFRSLSTPFPRLSVQSVKDHDGEQNAARGEGSRGWTLRTIRIEGAQGSLHKLPS